MWHHALYRVAEEIRKYFPNVVKHIWSGKKIFIKAPSRVNIFKEIAPTIPIPQPQPVLNRWEIWLNAAFYYCEHFDTIKYVTALDRSDATSIDNVLDLLSDSELQLNLIL
jgi:hypothetical protein